MSNWICYGEFVDLVRNHHHNNAFSGLINGVSDTDTRAFFESVAEA